MKLVYLVIITLWMIFGFNQTTFSLNSQNHKPSDPVHQTKDQKKIKTIKLASATKRSKPGHLKLASATKRSKPEHLKLASVTKRSKPEHLKLASATKRSKPEHLKLASATKLSKPEHLKLASATKRSKPEHLKLASAPKRSKPEHLKLASATKRSKPEQLKLASAIKRSKTEHLKLASATTRTKPVTLKLAAATKKNKPEQITKKLALATNKTKPAPLKLVSVKKKSKSAQLKLTSAAKTKAENLKLALATKKSKMANLRLAPAANPRLAPVANPRLAPAANLRLAPAANLRLTPAATSKTEHSKLALATKKGKLKHLKLASVTKKSNREQLKLASAAKTTPVLKLPSDAKSKPAHLNLARATKKSKPAHLKLARPKKSKPVQLKLARATKKSKPIHLKLSSPIKNDKPVAEKLSRASKKGKPFLLKQAAVKKNKPDLELALPNKKSDIAAEMIELALEKAKRNNRPAQKDLQKINSTLTKKLSSISRSLASELNNIIKNVDDNAVIGVSVKSMRNKEFLYSHNIYRPLTPASTLKILTAEAALLFLKPEYRFPTQLLTDAQTVKNGVLQGNLYIVLSGDPTLTYNDLVDLMLNLRTNQIFAISGNVYIDNTAYDQSFYGPDWVLKDKNYCYGAPISASIINHNCLPFKVTPSKVAGQSARVETSPNFFYPNIRNYVVTKSSRASCSVHLSSKLDNGLLEIDGCMQKGKEAWGMSYVVSDVSEYNRSLFKSLLNQLAIKTYGTITFGSAPKKSYMIAYHASEPLSQLIYDMLKKSDNVIAGALFKKLGQLYTHQPGSWENGSFAVSNILSKHAGMNTFGLKILDGSGLSPSNLASPLQMMQVLDFAYHHSPTNEAFISALPIGGIDGTLKHRMGNIARRVRAKTGTISGVVSLAGYVVSADKEIYAFVIMVNGNKSMTWKYKEMEDRIVTVLARYKRG